MSFSPIRILVALVIAIFLIAVIPPFFGIVGFPLSGDLMLIIRLCIAAWAVLYAFTGKGGPPL